MHTARNPETIQAPIGRYVHQIEVSNPSRLLFISGQVGNRPDGSVPADPVEQLEVALQNVLANLEAAGMGMESLVKLTTYVVGATRLQGRDRRLGRRLARPGVCRGVQVASVVVAAAGVGRKRK
jgi:2-iminobutanoate/2-iminopropanoate deaminase